MNSPVWVHAPLREPIEVIIPKVEEDIRGQLTFDNLVKTITDFESALDKEHEIGAIMVVFGNTSTFHISNIAYNHPDVIVFEGVDANKNRVTLVQHISQLGVLLIALPKLNEEPRRIGFQLNHNKPRPKQDQ